MRKIHTKVKRKFRIRTHLNGIKALKGEVKRIRPKTFSTEVGAHNWAKAHELTPAQYTLKPAKKNKRFMVVRNK